MATAILSAVALVYSELVRDLIGDRIGPYGYLGLIAAAWLAARTLDGRVAAKAILGRGLGVLFIVNVVVFFALEFGPFARSLDLLFSGLLLLFVSGLVAGAVVIGIALAMLFTEPRPPAGTVAAAVIVAVAIAVTIVIIGKPAGGAAVAAGAGAGAGIRWVIRRAVII